MVLRRLAVCVLLIGCSSLVLAQLDTASIIGAVSDASGAVVPGAKVEVRNLGTGQTTQLTTDQSGGFVAPVLPVGTYRVTVTAPGFKTNVQDNIRLNVADRIQLPIALVPGQISEVVNVSGEAPVVDTASTTLGGVVAPEQMSELPLNGRSLTQLLATTPGWSQLGVAPNLNGATTARLFETASRFLLDGTDSGQVDSDLADGGYQTRARITRASVESIAEVRVQQNSFSAEYGQASGGVINFITKSGTNQFHGSLFEYFRNEVLDAKPYDFTPGTAEKKPSFRLNQFGGSLGGPIIRNKLFFFANYEGVRQREGTPQGASSGCVPTEAYRAAVDPVLRPALDMLPLPNTGQACDANTALFSGSFVDPLTENTVAGKLDYHLSENDRLSMRYNRNASDTQFRGGIAQGQIRVDPYTSKFGKIAYLHNFSPSLLNEVGFGINRTEAIPKASDQEAVRNFPLVIDFTGVVPQIGPVLFDLLVFNTSFTYLDTLTWVKGRNQFKFGTQIVANRDNKAANFQEAIYYLGLGDLNTDPALQPFTYLSNIPLGVATIGNPITGQRNIMTNFFIQDDIQARPGLTLNLGLRYQYDTPPSEAHDRNRNFNFETGTLDPGGAQVFEPAKLSFAPRVGIAWTPFRSNSSFVVRAGFGIFHVSFNPAEAQALPTNDANFGSSRSVFFNPFLTIFPEPDIQSFVGAASLQVFPKHYRTPYSQDWNLNIQKGFGLNTVLQVGYQGTQGVHFSTFQDPNRLDLVNHVRPYPGFGPFLLFNSCCSSSYNALQATFKRRFSRGLSFNVNYTYSHAMDASQLAFGTQPQNDVDPAAERANADFDVRHLLEFDYIYELPAAPGIPKWLGKGWQINGITVMRSGSPVNITCGCDPTGTGGSNAQGRPDAVAGESPRPSNYSLPFSQINPLAFTTPAILDPSDPRHFPVYPEPGYHYGNVGRNSLRGPSVFNWDFSVFRNFDLGEQRQIQFRAEFFNIFNTPQFDLPVGNIQDPRFGQSVSTISTAGGFASNRQVQAGLKFLF